MSGSEQTAFQETLSTEIQSFLKPGVESIMTSISSIQTNQAELLSRIGDLMKTLEDFKEVATVVPLDEYSNKLRTANKRVTKLSGKVLTVQQRVGKMHRQVHDMVEREKHALEELSGEVDQLKVGNGEAMAALAAVTADGIPETPSDAPAEPIVSEDAAEPEAEAEAAAPEDSEQIKEAEPAPEEEVVDEPQQDPEAEATEQP
ncbi:Snapin/Pallidin/Snn1 [Carpediemonas membranifera]|uniref:Biogenesis of lysosome-related organelles complex 1 subunit 7 n=1 Tax=Carpediemonas membranifera TaxID=201153 RepID=A0A8J6ATK4_9EUKA|nr:Snapin/Pallidin/Snn1 [Carpediemonas membranifera]|eukprot:KAG9394246.1 Snapin/Pallidin/Snn1 [Carpediemonas membranifera]